WAWKSFANEMRACFGNREEQNAGKFLPWHIRNLSEGYRESWFAANTHDCSTTCLSEKIEGAVVVKGRVFAALVLARIVAHQLSVGGVRNRKVISHVGDRASYRCDRSGSAVGKEGTRTKKAADLGRLPLNQPNYAGAGRSPPLAIPGLPGSGLSTCCTPESSPLAGGMIFGSSLPSMIILISFASSTSRSSSAIAIRTSVSWLAARIPLAVSYPLPTSRLTSSSILIAVASL